MSEILKLQPDKYSGLEIPDGGIEIERNEDLISPYRIVIYPLDRELNKHLNHPMNCAICGRSYYSRKHGKYWKRTCGACDVFITCANEECRKENVITDHPVRALENVRKGKISACCLECNAQAKLQQNRKKVCDKCGGSKFNIMGLCMTCHNEEINVPIDCPKHGYQEFSVGGTCIKCIAENDRDRLVELARKNCDDLNNGFWKTNEGKALRPIVAAMSNGGTRKQFCPKCQKDTDHKGYCCCKCGYNETPQITIIDGKRFYDGKSVEEINKAIKEGGMIVSDIRGLSSKFGRLCINGYEDLLTGEIISIKDNKNFTVDDNGGRLYRDEPVEIIVEELLSGKRNIEEYPIFNIRCDRVCIGDIDLLTNEKIYLSELYQTYKDKRYYKGQSLEKLSKDIKSGEKSIEDYPEFNIRLGRLCEGARDVLTDEVILLNKTLQEKDGIYYYNNIDGRILSEQILLGEVDLDKYPNLYINGNSVCCGNIDIATGEKCFFY